MSGETLIPETAGQRLDTLRHRARLSKAALARLLGVSRQTVHEAITSGRVSAEMAERAAVQFGVGAREITEGPLPDAEPEGRVVRENSPGYAADPSRVVTLSLPTFDRTPYYRHRLSPAAYERLYGYMERLRQAGYDEEQLETAERIMVDPRYAKLNKSARGTPTEDDVLTFIDAGWAIVWEIATSGGIRVKGPRPHFGKAEEGA